jgi:hypothetical protein
MIPITFRMPVYQNGCIETIFATAFELGYQERGATRPAEKINRSDQKKGG